MKLLRVQDVTKALETWKAVRDLPEITINLMHDRAADNDPFFGRITEDYYRETQKRHRTVPLWRRNSVGMAIYEIRDGYDGFLKDIESSGRRNIKKAIRLGYTFEKIAFNDYLQDIAEIRSSTDVRQGEVPEAMKNGVVGAISDPESRNRFHGYPYYGALLDGKLYAYAGCMVAGEVCLIQHILGHAAKLSDGAVPFLISEVVRDMCTHHPNVKYVGYGTFFGASDSMKRFKKKFGLTPKKVNWVLSSAGTA